MNKADKRIMRALIISLLVHLLLVGAVVAKDRAVDYDQEDIYETTDFIDLETPTPTAENTKVNKNVERTYLKTALSFVLLDSKTIRRMEQNARGDTQTIVGAVEEKQLKQAHKQVPLEKNPTVKPKLTSFTPIPYPAGANGEVGHMVVCFLVGVDGIPEYVSTAQSSGSHIMDAAAIDHCISWRFSPAKDARGRNVRCLIYIPVNVEP